MPLASVSPSLEVSRGNFLQNLVVQGQHCHQLLKPGVVLLQGSESLGLVHPQSSVLGKVKRGATYLGVVPDGGPYPRRPQVRVKSGKRIDPNR